MISFNFLPFNPIQNPEYGFYKVFIVKILIDSEGNETPKTSCLYDEFRDSLTDNESNKLDSILSYMDSFTSNNLNDKGKFRHIHPLNKKCRNDIFEFKKKPIRVYVCKDDIKKRIFILSGGSKKSQPNEIKQLFNTFNKMILPD